MKHYFYPKIRKAYEDAKKNTFVVGRPYYVSATRLVARGVLSWVGLLLDDISQLEEEVKILREALEFYSAHKNYELNYDFEDKEFTEIEEDSGKIAREALEKTK